jgi:NAD(P)-dependent dehydrogenase (short-subunit alcohol dehydrogenase family)
VPRDCEGKVAFVAGASQFGTGTGTAVRLAAEGAKVAFCARDEEKMRKTADLIDAFGGDYVYWRCDLSDPNGGRDTLIARTEDAFGPIDYLVYVAAGGPYAPFETITQHQLQIALEMNCKAPWLLCQDAIASMKARGSGGAIVNIGTKAAMPVVGPPFLDIPPYRTGTMYGGTKAMLHRFTQGLAAEFYDDRISANVLWPLAAIGTPGLKAAGWIPPELMEPPETVVEAVIALLTADPQTLTGRDVPSIKLLAELQRPVYDWTGTELVEGWQPEDLPAYIDARAVPVPLPRRE